MGDACFANCPKEETVVEGGAIAGKSNPRTRAGLETKANGIIGEALAARNSTLWELETMKKRIP